MAKRKVEVDPKVTRHADFEDDRFSLTEGDEVRAHVPGFKRGATQVTFSSYVVPDNGVPYIEIEDRKGLIRCIRPEAIVSKKRKRRR